MNKERIRKEFGEIEIPDMKTEILAKLHQENAPVPRRRTRPVLIAAAALILVLTVAVGAAAGGMIRLIPGSRVYFRDDGGNIVRPQGFHAAESADVPLSEQALANIAPYVFDPGPGQNPTLFETVSRAEMEALIDMPLVLPEAVEEKATGYRLWAVGANGEAVSIYVQIRLDGDWGGDSVNVYLRGSLGSYITAGEPEICAHTLPDGSTASISVSETLSGTWSVFGFYTRDGAIYSLRLHRGESKKNALREAKTILDTLQ